jgi:hypothetical protein
MEEARATFDQLFGESIKKAKATASTKDDAELAGVLASSAKAATNSAELTTLVAMAAVEFGAKGPEGFETALEAMDLFLDQPADLRAPRMDDLATLCQSIVTRSRGADHDKAGTALMLVLVTYGDDRADAGDFAKAVLLYRRAVDAANAVKSPDLPSVQGKLLAATARQAAVVRVDALAKQVEANPADAAAREELVRLYLVELDNPEKAAKVIDPASTDIKSKLVLLAGMTAANLPEAACLQLGEMYNGLADTASAAAKPAMLVRARLYYATFLDKHAGADIQRVQAELAVKSLDDKIAKLAPRPKLPGGAILLLTFDKASVMEKDGSTFLRDYSGFNNHGILHGGKLVKGTAGESLTFDGNGTYVTVLHNARTFGMSHDVTISVWLNPSGTGDGTVFDKQVYNEGGLYFGYSTTGTLTYCYGNYGGLISTYSSTGSRYGSTNLTKTTFPSGEWTHLVLVRDLANRRIVWYKNGKKAGEAAAATPVVSSSITNMTLGKGYYGYYTGGMDELAIYPRALTEKEVQVLYDMGNRGIGVAK